MTACNASCSDTTFSHSSNLAAANAHLSQLLPLTQISDPDLSHQISLLEIALLMHPSRPDLPSAYRKTASLLAATSDLAQTLHLLTLKAAVFAAAGKPEKGFSIAVRAASRAERAGLVPVLLEALAALAEILNKVGAFGAARELAGAALPQVCLLYLGLVAKVFDDWGPIWRYPLTGSSI
jgi:anaphase-promoting complex subunit 5